MEHATLAGIGISMMPPNEAITEAADKYLEAFAQTEDRRCACGEYLNGPLGMFEWGVVHGEGRCLSCGWPARAFHEIDCGEYGKLQLNIALPYHSDYVDTEPTEAQLEAMNNPDSGPVHTESSPSYREAMRAAGRGGMLR